MATTREVRSLDHSHPHTRVVAAAPKQPLPGKCVMHHHHLFPSIHQTRSSILRLVAARTWVKLPVRSLSCYLMLVCSLCNTTPPCRTSKGPSWPHRCPWFPVTSLARRVEGSLART